MAIELNISNRNRLEKLLSGDLDFHDQPSSHRSHRPPRFRGQVPSSASPYLHRPVGRAWRCCARRNDGVWDGVGRGRHTG